MVLGAPLEEVWNSCGPSYSRAHNSTRAAPGSAPGCRQQRTQQQAQQQRPRSGKGGRTHSSVPGVPGPSEPLCDLYEKGYSDAVGDVMNQRASVRVPPPQSSKPSRSASCPSSASSSKSQCVRQPTDPEVDACDYVFSHHGQFTPVDFFDDDSNWASVVEDEREEEGFESGPGPGSGPSSSAPAPAKPRVSFADRHAEEDDDDGCDDYGGCGRGSDNRKAKAKALEGYRDPSPSPSPSGAGVDASTLWADMGLYVVSGVILIFLLEQFIQIGVRLRV